ncbi:MAG: helix-turn-helix transcriptional regulator [Ignavibacteriae bacterium]|nr:helix-turn-helix transcriptional regulator [Ignavibacteriota bacterium]
MPRAKPVETTTLLVKNMVCNRCIRVVREELENIGVDVRSVMLGEVVIGGTLDREKKGKIAAVLRENGFELIEDRRVRTIEQIKHAILKLVYEEDLEHHPPAKYSAYIAEKVGQDYHSLSTLFSSVENITIEQYIILQKIERVKELLKYGELTLSEISYKMGYSSVQHLSNQFKKVTGMTPSAFKNMVQNARTPLDKIALQR